MFASATDVQNRMDRVIASSESERVTALLQDVGAALVERYTEAQLDTLQTENLQLLKSAQARAVCRLLATPVGPLQVTSLDDASDTFFRNDGELLTKAETGATDRAVNYRNNGLVSMRLTASMSPIPEAE